MEKIVNDFTPISRKLQVGFAASAQVIQHGDLRAFLRQRLCYVGTDETGTSGHQTV